MHNIHKGEKSDVDIRQEDAVSGETNGDHCREGEKRIGTGTPGEKGIEG